MHTKARPIADEARVMPALYPSPNFCLRMKYFDRLAAFLSSSRSAVLLSILTVVLSHLPGAQSMLFTDDFMIRSQVLGSDRLVDLGLTTASPSQSLVERISHAFHFYSYKDGTTQLFRDYGSLPWWSSEQALMHPFRPIAAFTHWIDFAVFDGAPFMIGVLNLGGILLLWFSVFLLARHLSGSINLACVVAALLTFDFSLWQSFLWLAARNVYLAVALGTLCLYTYIRWRESGRQLWGGLSLLLFLLSLFTAEGAIAVLGYLGAYALIVDRRGWFWGGIALIPFVAIMVTWRVFYNKYGFGSENIGLYVDPGRSTVDFFWQLFLVFPCIVTSLITGADALVSSFAPEVRNVVRGLAWVVTLASVLLIRGYLRSDKVVRFLFLGSVIAVIPHATLLSAGNRSGAFVAIGFFYIFAIWLRGLWRKGRQLQSYRLLCVGVAGWHLFLPAVIALLYSVGLASDEYPGIKLSNISPDQPEGMAPSLVVVNSPMAYKLFYLPYEFDFLSQSLPESINALAPGLTSLSIKRVSERVFLVNSHGPLVVNHEVPMTGESRPLSFFNPLFSHQLLQGLVTTPNQKYTKGEARYAGKIRVTPLRTDAGVPDSVEVVFEGDESPDSMTWARYDWTLDDYVRMPVPEVGDVLYLPGPFETRNRGR